MMEDDRPFCEAATRDGSPCQRRVDDESERCYYHGGPNTGAPEGNDNGRIHGGFAETLDGDLEADEQDIVRVFEAAADRESLDPVWTRLAGEAYVRYRRSDDARHLAECRRCLENAGGDDATVALGDLEVVADFTNTE